MTRQKSKKNLMVVLGIALAVLIASTLFYFLRTPAQKNNAPTQTSASTETTSSPAKAGTQPVRQVQTRPQEYGQNLYRINMVKHESASLTDQFPFITELMSTHYDDAGEVLSAFPDIIGVADMAIPSKKLRLAALHIQSPDTCDRGYCPIDVYAYRNGKWEGVMSAVASSNHYILVDDNSVSLILCTQYGKGYERYRLPDGRLERPITVTDGEYFAFAGAFKHDKIAACP